MTAKDLEVVRPHTDAPIAYQPRAELTVQELVAQVAKIQEVMKAVMQPDVHYGIIPGTPKPTLYKAGAEKLCLLFRLDPQYESIEHWDGPHLTVKTKCTLYHIPTGERRGSAEGSCSTRESKYAWRKGERVCPECGKNAIIKGKTEYGGGWLCYGKKGGCSAKFKDADPKITEQNTDRIPNPDLPDTYNTVLKLSNKRSLVAAVLNVTAASDCFMQDLEDLPQPEREPFRPTEEQLRQAREADPEPRPSKQADLGEGFGSAPAGPRPDYAAMGEPIRKAQVTMFKRRCAERAEAIGATELAVERGVLEKWNLTRSEELGQKIFQEALGAVAKFEPDFGAQDEPGDASTTDHTEAP